MFVTASGLGRYKETNDRPRPVLIKMNRSIDVINILAARKNLPSHLAIKPDLSPKDRLIDSTLMKERWSLIQSGQDKKDIKIQGTKLYLKGNVYGSVIDSKFVSSSHSENTQAAKQKSASSLTEHNKPHCF